MRIIIASIGILLLAILERGHAQSEPEQVTGIMGKRVRLACPLEVTADTRIQWVDWIYNQGRDPSDIYDSARGTIASDHQNVDNFMVDESDHSLTIKNLKFDDNDVIGDAGEYICRLVAADDSEVDMIDYGLNVVGRPKCSDDVDVMEGAATKLSCSVQYSSSSIPKLQWYTGETEVDSMDMLDIGLAMRDVAIDSAVWSMDGSKYTCRMTMDQLDEEQCELDMTVKYMARDLKFMPETGPLRVNDEVTCTANGNPEPRIEFEVTGAALPQVAQQTGSRSFKVPKTWQGLDVVIKCSASNSLEGTVEHLKTEHSFNVEGTVTTPSAAGPDTTPEAPTAMPAERKTTAADKVIEPTPTAAPVSKGSTNIAGIVAAVVIVALVVVVIVIAVVCIKRKNSKKPKGAKPVPTKEEEVRALEGGKGGTNNGSTPQVTYTKINTQPDNTNHAKPNGNLSQQPLLSPDNSDPKPPEDEVQITYADLDFENQGTNTGMTSPADDTAAPNDQSPWQRRPSDEIVYSDIQTDANK